MDKLDQLDELFQSARVQQPVYSFDDAKRNFLTTVSSYSLTAKKSPYYSLNNWIIMIITASSLIIALILFSSKDESHIVKEKPTIQSVKKVCKSQITEKEEVSTSSEKSKTLFKPFQPFEEVLESHQPATDQSPVSPEIESKSFKEKEMYTIPNLDDEYPFPKLTDKEIAANHKQKKEMLKALEKFDKKSYAIIASGSFNFNGELISVQSFLIQKTEVSNLEYRTFLFDLLIQGRKDEFLRAKPDQKQWSILANQENNPYEQHYFSHPAYNNYPVVNVSREGAEMYCKWLSEELQNFVEEKKKGNYNDMRLPFREEWVMAASIEGKQGPYPWGGPFTRNSKGMLLANYKIALDELKFNDSIAQTSTDLTAPVNAYYPNDFGLYNMSGNVAEMVYDNYLAKLPGTAGGAWRSTAEEIKILAPDPYPNVVDANPCIGFRVVMTIRTQN